MAQTTILAAGDTAATSTDVVVAAGATANVGIFSAGAVPAGTAFRVLVATPGADMVVGHLSAANPYISVTGPGTFRVRRDALPAGMAVGAYSDT